MTRHLTLFLLLTLMISCGNTNKKKNSFIETGKPAEISFYDFSDKIPLLTLPLSSTCETELKVSYYGFTNNEIRKFGRDNCSILGKLVDNEKYTAIIYLQPSDTQLPIIVTTDKKGRKIDELELYHGYCGEDINCRGTSWFEIDKDLNIQLNDSSIEFDRDNKDEIIESTKETFVSHKQFRITDNGKIIEIKKTMNSVHSDLSK